MRREGLLAREYTQSLLGPLLAASANSTPMAARSERYSAGDAAGALAASALVRMSATHDLSPRASAARSPRLRLARAVGRARGSLERWGRPRSASSRWKERLSSRGSGTWSRLPVSSEVLLTTTCAWGMRPSLSSW